MADDRKRTLLIGYGNPGRRDDGLGPAMAAALEALRLPGLTVEVDYQLIVEHAALAAEHDIVVFADAAVSGPEPFYFRRIEPKSECSFSTHSLSPAGVLALARELFGATCRGYVLGIRGYHFDEFGEELSWPARANLAAAVKFVKAGVTEARWQESGVQPDAALARNAARCDGDT
jgi:hydrogenase maturation protease